MTLKKRFLRWKRRTRLTRSTWKLGNWLNCLVTVADPEFAPELPDLPPGRFWLCLRASRGGGGGGRGVVGGGRVWRVVVGLVVRLVG